MPDGDSNAHKRRTEVAKMKACVEDTGLFSNSEMLVVGIKPNNSNIRSKVDGSSHAENGGENGRYAVSMVSMESYSTT